jgi:hypothetical protein
MKILTGNELVIILGLYNFPTTPILEFTKNHHLRFSPFAEQSILFVLLEHRQPMA